MRPATVAYRWGGHPAGWLGGCIADIPTPFTVDGSVDVTAFAHLCERQIAAGASSILVCDIAGEAWTLTPDERAALIGSAVETSGKRAHVIAGASSPATGRAVELTRQAAAAGADAIMTAVPCYNRPMQDGILAHFRAVADATALPVILHDCPARTARPLADDTLIQLAQSSQFVGLTDGSGDISRVGRLRARLQPGFRLLTGDDASAPGFLAEGGDGWMSAVANAAPEHCAAIVLHSRRRRFRAARQPHRLLTTLIEAIARDTPAALKYALSLQGLIRPDIRLPLVEPDETAKVLIRGAMAGLASECEKLREADECRPPAVEAIAIRRS